MAIIDSDHHHTFYFTTISRSFLMFLRFFFLPQILVVRLVRGSKEDQQIKRFVFEIALLTKKTFLNTRKKEYVLQDSHLDGAPWTMQHLSLKTGTKTSMLEVLYTDKFNEV